MPQVAQTGFWGREHPQRPASINKQVSNAKPGLPREGLKKKKKKCAGVICYQGEQLNLISRPGSYPAPRATQTPILSHPRIALAPTEAALEHMVILAECLSVYTGTLLSLLAKS